MGARVGEAFDKALATDPLSAFGGVFCVNRPVDGALAEKLNELFVEVVFAPGYDEDAFEMLQSEAERPVAREPGAAHHADRRSRTSSACAAAS